MSVSRLPDRRMAVPGERVSPMKFAFTLATLLAAAAYAAPSAFAGPDLKAKGAQVYATNCASCHQATGQGLAGVFPPLVGSEYTNKDPKRHIKIVLKGLQGSIQVAGKTYNGIMPAFAHLSDEDIAAVVTYERLAWGNKGGAVKTADVKALR